MAETTTAVRHKQDVAAASSGSSGVESRRDGDLADPLSDPLSADPVQMNDDQVCEAETFTEDTAIEEDQCVMPEDPACEQYNEENFSEVELQRLRAVAEILRYEDENGTWATITNYNAITGDIPGRNVWVRLAEGGTADLCWMFDVAVMAGGVGGTVSQVLGSFGGRVGEFIGAVLGQATGGLSYWGARLVGAGVEGFSGGGIDAFTSYLEGSVNEDNLEGANMALELAWGNSFGGESLTIRELIHPEVIRQINCLRF